MHPERRLRSGHPTVTDAQHDELLEKHRALYLENIELRGDVSRLSVQAERAVRSWNDDPTSIYTENAMRELGLRARPSNDAGTQACTDYPRNELPGFEVVALDWIQRRLAIEDPDEETLDSLTRILERAYSDGLRDGPSLDADAHRSETASVPLPDEVRSLLSAFRHRLLGERTIGGLPEPVPTMLDRASLVARIGKALGEVKP